ncbi:MAG: hypothetical protein A3A86_02110 [Elusimicrobia bacterium RIFCSPLOWO2_01_FULL_60_11]|nr:MAG: hypothetical protein A3A86_02110 [Elusimicrobia bacterium RIFCSPLOWO2_01_FULL_60_11]
MRSIGKGDFGLIILLFGCLSASEIQAVTLLGESEVGQRSTSEDFDGEDQEDDYQYLNGHLALDGRISSKLTAESDAYRKTKDYEFLNDLDNQTDAFTVKPILLLRDEDKRSLKADFRANYRHKRYENQPRLDYNQIDLSQGTPHLIQPLGREILHRLT